jgi:hypothetical protein
MVCSGFFGVSETAKGGWDILATFLIGFFWGIIGAQEKQRPVVSSPIFTLQVEQGSRGGGEDIGGLCRQKGAGNFHFFHPATAIFTVSLFAVFAVFAVPMVKKMKVLAPLLPA